MKRSKSSRILKILSYVLLITGMIVILYPFYLTIITALKTPQESSQSFFSFPQSFYLGNFVNVLQKANYFVFFRNSAVVTLVSVFLIMVLIPMCSYAIARNMEKRYYKTMYFYLLAGIFVPFQVIMVPLVKYLAKLKLCNIPGLIIMCVTLASSQGVFLLVNYIRSVPRDLILVVSFSIYYTKKIIEPLEEFCKKISHTKGDQLQIINLEHMKLTREIANVIENYNEMANKMNEYLVREIIYDKNQRKIQSKMLRYQINPHFLYNTLNLIASMGELSDFPEIVEITKNLSCIMQYNVKGSRFVSLKTEVEMVKAYLEIQRIRFHDCFSVEYEIERQIEQVRIVKFILQPIVENIFEHGFTMDENDNKIWIKAFKCENDIVILVKDNGCGIDSEKREELNRILCERTRRISYIDEEEKSIGKRN